MDLRPLDPTELVAAHTALELAFGSDPHADDREVDVALLGAEDTLGVVDDGGIVGTAAWYELPMTVPGGVTDVAGVTWVSVAPTHRRRGLVRQLMTRQLDDLHERGRPLAALWASEAAIYQRFGYGCAAWNVAMSMPAALPFVRPVDVGGLRLVDPTDAPELRAAYDLALGTRPGWWARDERWWRKRLHDPARSRDGMTQLRAVVDDDRGYALYRTQNRWGSGGPDGVVAVVELVAAEPEVEARLWRFLLDQDLMRHLRAWGSPSDSPLLHLLAEPRRAEAKVSDALWVRLVDVGAALARRTRATDADVVVEVTDETCPWNAGRYRLDGSATTDAPDLSCDVRDLGAAYLGGTTLAARAAAGWVVEHRAGALAAASQALSWPGRAPHAPLVF